MSTPNRVSAAASVLSCRQVAAVHAGRAGGQIGDADGVSGHWPIYAMSLLMVSGQRPVASASRSRIPHLASRISAHATGRSPHGFPPTPGFPTGSDPRDGKLGAEGYVCRPNSRSTTAYVNPSRMLLRIEAGQRRAVTYACKAYLPAEWRANAKRRVGHGFGFSRALLMSPDARLAGSPNFLPRPATAESMTEATGAVKVMRIASIDPDMEPGAVLQTRRTAPAFCFLPVTSTANTILSDSTRPHVGELGPALQFAETRQPSRPRGRPPADHASRGAGKEQDRTGKSEPAVFHSALLSKSERQNLTSLPVSRR